MKTVITRNNTFDITVNGHTFKRFEYVDSWQGMARFRQPEEDYVLIVDAPDKLGLFDALFAPSEWPNLNEDELQFLKANLKFQEAAEIRHTTKENEDA